jgi:hypothetical protein
MQLFSLEDFKLFLITTAYIHREFCKDVHHMKIEKIELFWVEWERGGSGFP